MNVCAFVFIEFGLLALKAGLGEVLSFLSLDTEPASDVSVNPLVSLKSVLAQFDASS